MKPLIYILFLWEDNKKAIHFKLSWTKNLRLQLGMRDILDPQSYLDIGFDLIVNLFSLFHESPMFHSGSFSCHLCFWVPLGKKLLEAVDCIFTSQYGFQSFFPRLTWQNIIFLNSFLEKKTVNREDWRKYVIIYQAISTVNHTLCFFFNSSVVNIQCYISFKCTV